MQPAAKHPQTVKDFMRGSRSRPKGRVGRVAIVSDSLPERNGVGAYYRDLVDQLEEHDCETAFICPDGSKDFIKMPLPGDSTQRIWIPSVRRFRREIKALRPEAIVAATPGPYGLLAAWWARHLQVPLIVGFHTHFSGVTDHYKNRFLRGFSRFYFNVADSILFRYADLVLANSEGMVALAEKLGARRVEVMGTLLPTDSLQEPARPIGNELRRVVFAGRLAPEKRVHWIIDAARELPGVEFTIAGDGPLKDEVMQAAEELENLECLGWVTRRELLEQMDRADILALPSVVESFGTVALEAMARERLALVTPTCGIVEWGELAQCLYQLEEGQSVADALRTIAALPAEERRDMARRARNAACELNRNSVMHWFGILEVEEPDDDENSAESS